MAAVKGSNMTKLTTFPVDYPDASEAGGRVRVFSDTYAASGLAAASTITIARLPKGARVWDIHIFHDDLGTTAGTLSVMWARPPGISARLPPVRRASRR